MTPACEVPLHTDTTLGRPSQATFANVLDSATRRVSLITSSYLVGACTGKSAGFSPNEMSQTPPYPPANNVFDALIVHDAEILHRLAHASRPIS